MGVVIDINGDPVRSNVVIAESSPSVHPPGVPLHHDSITSPNDPSPSCRVAGDFSGSASASTALANGFLVPSQSQSDKLRLKKADLLSRNNTKPESREVISVFPVGNKETQERDATATDIHVIKTLASFMPHNV